MQYLSCAQASPELIYQIFLIEMSENPAQKHLSNDEFLHKYFTLEGNALDTSFIAIDKETPAGIILGGVRLFAGSKTMRCGSFYILPEYRGKGVAAKLFSLHKALAKKANCSKLIIDVPKGNSIARQFFLEQGYQNEGEVSHYCFKGKWPLCYCALKLQETTFETAHQYSLSTPNTRLMWQHDFPSIQQDTSLRFFAAYSRQLVAGILIISKYGTIKFLHVGEFYRRRGIASALLCHAFYTLGLQHFYLPFVRCNSLVAFSHVMGFNKHNLEQLGMSLTLK